MREIYQVIKENYAPGETVAAAPYYSFGARIAHEKLGVPLATLTLLPYDLRSIFRSPVMPRPMVLEDWVPKISKKIQFWIMDRFFADRVLGPITNAFRAELGMPPVKRFLNGWCFSPDRVICFFPEWFAEPQPDWPSQTIMTGFPRWDPDISLREHREVFEFIEKGNAPVIFTPGSYNQHGRQFLQTAVESCLALGRRGILLTRYRDQLPDQLPPEVRHFDFAPLAKILPHAAALVSHGGIGTIAQALAAGIPQLVMPIAYNQPDDAVRLKRLGVADFIPPRRFTGSLVTRKLGNLLNSSDVAEQCEKLAGMFTANDVIDQTCDLLEELQGRDGKAHR
jgi:UDP:flavonoid glycosyltransferase YjiC (YdhE family)